MTAPLGCSLEPAETLAPEQFGRLRLLDEFDLSFLDRNLIPEKTENLIWPEMANIAKREFKRFLALPTMLFPGAIVTPSAQVDAVWHLLILDTPRYRNFCPNVLGRDYLDHIQTTPMSPIDNKAFGHTLDLYRQAFGEPPAEMWAPVPQHAAPRAIGVGWPLVGLFGSLTVLFWLAGAAAASVGPRGGGADRGRLRHRSRR